VILNMSPMNYNYKVAVFFFSVIFNYFFYTRMLASNLKAMSFLEINLIVIAAVVFINDIIYLKQNDDCLDFNVLIYF